MSTRRHFVRLAASAGLVAAQAQNKGVALIAAASPTPAPVEWALGELEAALRSRGVAVKRAASAKDAGAGDLCILTSRTGVAAVPEATGLIPKSVDGRSAILAAGHDTRGMVYALLDLKDRVDHAPDVFAALTLRRPVLEAPANRIRAISRLFCSDVEDKGWFNDREMWQQYLTMLATQRFNRFHLAFGIGYDFLRQVTDAYFLFPYPFLLKVPGYDVRATPLPDAERDRNLAMLKFISEQTAARGMEFQLGLWMHGYEWLDTKNANYNIEGLTHANHGAYCRDAVRLLLKELPAVSGVTFRVHGESGVEEGSYDFWKQVFEGVATCGRRMEIDMHAKGMDQTMIDLALATKQPVKISPKYWAEHMGMPYHQADIRDQEVPKAGKQASALMKFSAGSRSFLRYGYGDLLREDRQWGVLHRIWPGTQRLLLWADPSTAAAHARGFSFCGSDGVDIMEPLSFKGRRGSGIAGDRCAYADASLRTRWDWQKYKQTYRVWGRLLFNPEADPDTWRRPLAPLFGKGARAAEAALANASRILPIVTTTHGTSAANNSYWPEVYFNQSMLQGGEPYTDTPAPKVFGNVSPFDPQLFSRINDYADALLAGEVDGKYSPIEVAQWLEGYADAAWGFLRQARTEVSDKNSAEYRRLDIDVEMQIGLGRFFGAKFRSGVLYRIFEKTGDKGALEQAVAQYKKARAAWAALAELGKVYVRDITIGERPQLRGHWLDRLPSMDRDIAALEAKFGEAKPNASAASAVQAALGHPKREIPRCGHTPPAKYRAGAPVELELSVAAKPSRVILHYRHVTQAERFQKVEMKGQDKSFRGVIPAEYTNLAYPLEYYFELQGLPSGAVLFPGFDAQQTNQPYYVIRRA